MFRFGSILARIHPYLCLRSSLEDEGACLSIHTLYHPSVFQGRHKKQTYFEGWYFKMATETEVLALIPGISLGAGKQDRHSFIQVISSREQKSWYVRYPFEAFTSDTRTFNLELAGNRFSSSQIIVDLQFEDLDLHGSVNQMQLHPYPVTVRSPGIMGWYAYVPFMECFHGVVSMHHRLEGSLDFNGRTMDLHAGIGYMEKDWGTSFPEAWIWLQSNCFPSKEVSCMLSFARIPFLSHQFNGFLGFLLLDGQLIRFGTYTGAKMLLCETDGNEARIIIKDKKYLLEFHAVLGPSSHLVAPREGAMERTLLESIEGTIEVTVRNERNELVFQETGTKAGIEISEARTLNVKQNKQG